MYLFARAMRTAAQSGPLTIDKRVHACVKASVGRVLAQERPISAGLAAQMFEATHELKPLFGCAHLLEAHQQARAGPGLAPSTLLAGARTATTTTAPGAPLRSVARVLASLAASVDALDAAELDSIAREHVHLGVLANDHALLGALFVRMVDKHCALTAEELAAWQAAHEVISRLLIRHEEALRAEFVGLLNGGHRAHRDIDVRVVAR